MFFWEDSVSIAVSYLGLYVLWHAYIHNKYEYTYKYKHKCTCSVHTGI